MGDELGARRRVVRLRKELARTRMLSAMLHREAQNHSVAADVRAETKRLRGMHRPEVVMEVPPATEEEAGRVATTLMQKLMANEVDASKRSWFTLFKECDSNSDGHISYQEVRLF